MIEQPTSTTEVTMLTPEQIGELFTVPWSPNPHRLEFVRPRNCQLHGVVIGMEAGLRKRRNSETRPWGSISVVSADHLDIIAYRPEPRHD